MDQQAQAGGPDTEEICSSAEQLAQLLYPDLKRAARGIRRRTGGSSTLQTTALIHEAYLKFAGGGQWQSRHHFLAAAAVAMRHVLVDQARARMTLRRGEGIRPVSLDATDGAGLHESLGHADQQDLCVAVGDAVEALGRLEPRLARVVECRYFAGFTEAETAGILGVTTRTIRRDWVKARAWLRAELGEDIDVAADGS